MKKKSIMAGFILSVIMVSFLFLTGYNINEYSPKTGKLLKDDSTTINVANIVDSVYDSSVGALKTINSIDGTGSGQLIQEISGTIDSTYTLSASATQFEFVNDDTVEDIIFTVNSIPLTLKAGEVDQKKYDSTTSVTVDTTNSAAYRLRAMK